MSSIDIAKAVKIAEGVHWIGFYDEKAGFHCNPYLLIDGDEAILFDPGSVQDFPCVLSKVCQLVDFKQITHIIVTHQDPDLCGAIPRFEELIYGVGGSCKIVTSTRASFLISYYGVISDFYCVDQNDWSLTLRSGRELKFTSTPFMHFPGAFVTYDPETKILFSGDIFGAFSFTWELYANEHYIEAMKAFLENYLPSNKIVRYAMAQIEKRDIRMIAPQHGSVINKDIQKHIDALKGIECGIDLEEE